MKQMSLQAGATKEVRGVDPLRAPDTDQRSVAAIVYANEVFPDALFRQLVASCRAGGIAVAGVLQHLAAPGGDRRCDVFLEDLASGHRTQLFENRGSEARGCRLDGAALAEAAIRIERSLETEPGLLLLNKFGKVEAEGEGMRGLIAAAMDRGIPVIIGVPARNLDTWRDFVGELAVELPADFARVQQWLRSVWADDAAVHG